MNKKQFLVELKESLRQFPESEIKDVLNYYDEMISDKVEQGRAEEEVIESLGGVKLISTRIQTELIDLRTKEPKPSIAKTSNNFYIVLLLCATPALIPLGIAFFAVFFSIFVSWIALTFAFAITSIALLVGLIPIAVTAFADMGIGGALVVSGVLLILSGIFALLTMIVALAGSNLLNVTVKTTNKIINKFTKRGNRNEIN